MMPLCEMTVNDALVPAHNSKHHNRSDSILAVSDNYSRFRVLSVDPTGYGAATSRFFTIYENFSGKIVSVLLEYNFLFFFNIASVKVRHESVRKCLFLAFSCRALYLIMGCSMKVNKKRLAEIFNVDPRTIERWQSQGLPCVSKGSKGIESVFDTAMAIQWYAQRETDIENEKLRKELADLRAAAESDLQPGTIDYERYRLTKAQADAQELKNAREDGVVLETELFTFILQRVAQEISGILVRVPLTLQRKYPDISPSHLDVVKTEIAKASNVAAKAGENVGGWIDDFRRTEGS